MDFQERMIQKSLPMRGEWIEITAKTTRPSWLPSLPMRGEWIEIPIRTLMWTVRMVSPHAGRVD